MATDPKAPAFAKPSVQGKTYEDYEAGDDGLSKREYFAAMALQGLLSRNENGDAAVFAAVAVGCADALIEALNK